jgi:hypothetical protein
MIQIIECKCGKVIAGCAVHYCYESEEWHESLRYHTSRGCVIKLLITLSGLAKWLNLNLNRITKL